MEAVFHASKESDRHLRDFAEKHADFALRELKDFRADDLKVLLRAIREENRTFEQMAG